MKVHELLELKLKPKSDSLIRLARLQNPNTPEHILNKKIDRLHTVINQNVADENPQQDYFQNLQKKNNPPLDLQ